MQITTHLKKSEALCLPELKERFGTKLERLPYCLLLRLQQKSSETNLSAISSELTFSGIERPIHHDLGDFSVSFCISEFIELKELLGYRLFCVRLENLLNNHLISLSLKEE